MRKTATVVLLTALAACSPAYVDRGREQPAEGTRDDQVVYKVHDSYRAKPPACVAILPLVAAPGIDADKAEAVRRAFYAHLSPQGKRDVELARIDFVLKGLPPTDRASPLALGRALECEAVIAGEVLEYGWQFLGIYSRVAVGAELQMVRTTDGTTLWEGRHVAATHGGSLPLSPIGVAMGILDAARNLQEEQTLRVVDDLTRRLVSTIPDHKIAELDDPAAPPSPVRLDRPAPPPPPPAPPKSAADWMRSAETLIAQGNYDSALADARQAVELSPRNGAAHFLEGRILIKLGRAEQAEPAIVRAVALDGKHPLYLNALGYLNGQLGRPDRALAAYRMAIEAQPGNGFAWYNTAVLLYQAGDDIGAGDAFHSAGMAYVISGHYGQAEKALADLRDLSREGLNLKTEIDSLERALAALEKKG